ncbi:MAG: dihydrodipicolinate synthase family protein [Propylenella sp.]
MHADAKVLRRPAAVELKLPARGGRLEAYRMGAASPYPAKAAGPFNRVALAAAHVVSDPLADHDPWLSAAIDWDATIAYRRHLWALGFSVAEAMDTAQRGMGLDWRSALELIRRSAAAAEADGHRMLASGAGTDHLDPTAAKSLDDVIRAYEEQFEAIEAAGSPIILMASRALVRVARSSDDYLKVYDRLLSQAREPVIIHWLGEMFDPQLAGYWGSPDIPTAMATALAAIRAHPDKVDGIKISLLDAAWEIEMRRQLPAGVRMYTGDDFNFADLIAGDSEGHSDALLGIFDAIAPAASAALSRLAAKDEESFHRILGPTVPLSRLIFSAPTRFYKTGVVFLAWLNGHQDHFTMVGGQESARSITHLAEVFRLADRAGLFSDPELAAARMRALLAVHGIG